MPLTVSMLLELASATAWTFYYIFEAAVKLFIPSKMFHKVCKQKLMTTSSASKQTLSQDISGQIVLVTGGGSGIGRLMCLKLVSTF